MADPFLRGPARVYLAPTDAPVDVHALDPESPAGQEWWLRIAGPPGEPSLDAEVIDGSGYTRVDLNDPTWDADG